MLESRHDSAEAGEAANELWGRVVARMLVAHKRFWFSHTKEGTCLVKCPSPDDGRGGISCKPPSWLPTRSLSISGLPLPLFQVLEISPLVADAHIPLSLLAGRTAGFSTRGKKEGRDRKHQPW